MTANDLNGYEILMAIRGDIGELKAMTTNTQKTLAEHVVENRTILSRVIALETGQAASKTAASIVSAAAKTAAVVVLRS